MIHPSYVELMKVVNDEVEIGEEPVVNSRYSIVIATANAAGQLSRKRRRMRNRKFDIHESGKDDRSIILFGVHLE